MLGASVRKFIFLCTFFNYVLLKKIPAAVPQDPKVKILKQGNCIRLQG